MLDALAHDLRTGWREVRRGRGISAAAVLTLAVGIAAATAMFALVDGMLMRPLPVRDQQGIVVAWREPRGTVGTHVPFKTAEIDTLRAHATTLTAVAGINKNGVGEVTLIEAGQASAVLVAHVTGAFFQVLGTDAWLGRPLRPSDDVAGAPQVLVLSHGLWRRRYGGAENVLGRRLTIGQQPFRIVGVMPPGLEYPRGVEAWTTVTAMRTAAPNETFRDAIASELDLVARLRDGVSALQAAAEIDAIAPKLDPPPVGPPGELRAAVHQLEAIIVGDTRATVLALFGAVLLVLLIASVNVANLLLMRGAARRTELAVRAALGAGAGRLARAQFVESLVLAAAGGLLAAPLAWWMVRAIVRFAPAGLPRIEDVVVEWRALLFAAAVSLVAAAMAGVAPVWGLRRENLAERLGSGARQTSGRGTTFGRRALVTAQIALAVVVVAATALLAQSLLRLQAIDPGLDVERVMLVRLTVPPAITNERARHVQLLRDLVDRLESSGRIAAATPINVHPFGGVGWEVPAFTAAGQDARRAAANPSIDLEAVHPNYFETLGVDILRGRAFTAGDRDGAPLVAIVSEDVATRTWPGQDAIGQRLKMGNADADAGWLRVVGVARGTRYRELRSRRPVLYVPAEQLIVAAQSLAIRTTAPLADVATIVRAGVAEVDPSVHALAVMPLVDLRAAPLARPRFTAALAALFSLSALLLCALGVFAVMGASVQQRQGELRVRAALGATPLAVQRLVLGEGLRLAAAGTIIGLGGAAITARALADLLFEVQPFDPPTFVAAAALLCAVSLLACALPAWRASRLDALGALRQD
ncbi:MAG TPA: ADOP family duplicated permease [Vicinamibacterales bacterium]|nr:ADOP family duplicated permease [Vicinamibacterales bacterium]